jgi:uncharacterized protein (TIRG00374 family)
VSPAGVRLPRRALPHLLLRLGVAAALLWLVFRMVLPDAAGGIAAALGSAWQTGPEVALAWLAAAFVILGISFAIGASRFSILLRGAEFELEWRALFRAYLVAGFFNLVLPGAILGDVYRLWDVRQEAGQGSRALGILVVERLLSLAALGCLGLAAAPFIPLAEDDQYLAGLLIGLCALVAASTLAALHPAGNRLMRRLAVPLGRVSERVAGAAEGALGAVAELSERREILARAFFLSLLNQGLPVAAVWLLAQPLAGDVAWYWFAVIVPFVTLVSLVPISIGGTGVREYLYVALFGALGMPATAALALSLSVLAVAIVWALVGLAIFTLDRRAVSSPAPESAC